MKVFAISVGISVLCKKVNVANKPSSSVKKVTVFYISDYRVKFTIKAFILVKDPVFILCEFVGYS